MPRGRGSKDETFIHKPEFWGSGPWDWETGEERNFDLVLNYLAPLYTQFLWSRQKFAWGETLTRWKKLSAPSLLSRYHKREVPEADTSDVTPSPWRTRMIDTEIEFSSRYLLLTHPGTQRFHIQWSRLTTTMTKRPRGSGSYHHSAKLLGFKVSDIEFAVHT